MTDVTRVGPEAETPVNPYSLLEAVNNSSDTAHTAWLIFLGIMAYLMIAVAGVSHKDLLLETPVNLPVLQVRIEQAQFFQFAPVILVLFHLGVVSQHVLLARKTLEFDNAVRSLEVSERRTHPLRLELHNFFFVQAIAGPHRSVVMSAFLHSMSWLTLVILPVVLILYIQIKFLPYHDESITWAHRAALVVDILMLVLIGIFLMRAETSFFQAFFRTTRDHPLAFIATTTLLAAVSFFSFFVATIPDEPLDRLMRHITGVEPDRTGQRAQLSMGFRIPFLTSRADGSLWGFFHRNLIVTDLDLVSDKDVTASEASLNLRGRDLRFARLDRSDLHQADLTGANLDGASLVGADLRGVRLSCADRDQLLRHNREEAQCASAVAANFSRATMSEARLAGLNLNDAVLEDANVEAADLTSALMIGANLKNAILAKIDADSAQMLGANLLTSHLQGADLTGAKLQFADFTSASLQGVNLSFAELQGAVMRGADLEGAVLQQAQLHSVDLADAAVLAADLRNIAVWMTSPPADSAPPLVDLTDLEMKPLGDSEAAGIKASIDQIANAQLRARLTDRLATIASKSESQKWTGSPEQTRWSALLSRARIGSEDVYRQDLTDHLARLMCKSRWSNGIIANGIARRAANPTFRGNMLTIYDRLRSPDCPAGKAVLARVMRQLSETADAARSR
jgi:uncharacterized protein YjbI with pentapeptide repeats